MTHSKIRASYDAIAGAYAAAYRDELEKKPIDRALLDAFAELAATGTIGDVGCGPGHVTRYLASRHNDVVGMDLSPKMVSFATRSSPALRCVAGDITEIPFADDSWAGAVVLYSIIHLTDAERARAFRELARVIRPGGWILVSFHIDSPGFAAGDSNHVTTWFDQHVDLEGRFLNPDHVARDAEQAAFTVTSTLIRLPDPGAEYPSRRCYLLAQRRDV